MTMLLAAAIGGLDSITVTGSWSGVTTTSPATTSTGTGDPTLTWNAGGARTISLLASFSYEHRINSGSWTAGAASVTSGQTLGFRITSVTGPDGSETCYPYDNAKGENIGAGFTHTWTGFP